MSNTNEEKLLNVCKVHYAKNNFKSCLFLLQRRKGVLKKSLTLNNFKGVVEFQLGRIDDALPTFKQSIAINNQSFEAWKNNEAWPATPFKPLKSFPKIFATV